MPPSGPPPRSMTSQDGQAFTAQGLLGGRWEAGGWMLRWSREHQLTSSLPDLPPGSCLHGAWKETEGTTSCSPCRPGPLGRQVVADRLWKPEQHRRRERHQRHLQARRTPACVPCHAFAAASTSPGFWRAIRSSRTPIYPALQAVAPLCRAAEAAQQRTGIAVTPVFLSLTPHRDRQVHHTAAAAAASMHAWGGMAPTGLHNGKPERVLPAAKAC